MPSSTLVFRIHLGEDAYREIEVLDSISLYDLAEAIINAFNFQFDHCFGFYNETGAQAVRSSEAYELFVDDDGEGLNPNARGVKGTAVNSVFTPGKTMTFLFDYGDEWHFTTKCIEAGHVVADQDYPFVREGSGDVEQYHEHDHCGCGHGH